MALYVHYELLVLLSVFLSESETLGHGNASCDVLSLNIYSVTLGTVLLMHQDF